MPTKNAALAMSNLRNFDHFEWYVIPIFLIVFYIYSVEVERRNWNVLFAGLALWGWDWFNEIWNGLIFHFTNYAPAWAAPGKTAFLLLIGLNIEISLMFAIMGIATTKMLPADRGMKVLGVPNRLFFAVANSVLAVLVEMFLNRCGVLTWDHPWWGVRAPWLIFLLGYFPFFVVAFWVHDMKTVRQKAITVGAIFAFDIVCLAVFGGLLKWI